MKAIQFPQTANIQRILPRYARLLEHLSVLLGFAFLTVIYTWPLVAQFTTATIGVGDARHHLWLLWHTREALMGGDGLFFTHLLYHPTGISLLTHALGPVLGTISLPFWLLGPEAANNGTIFLAFLLTGYVMYLLARSVGFSIPISLFAGTVLLVAPIHVAALYGHMNKVFIAPIPLALLMALKAAPPQSSRWWSFALGSAMLLALLHSAEQFVYAGFGIGIILVVQFVRAAPPDRIAQLKQWFWIFLFVVVLCGPILVAIQQSSAHSGINVNRNLESVHHQPDLMAFFVPVDIGFAASYFHEFTRRFHRFEGYVFLTWTALALLLFAIAKARHKSLPWLILTISCIIFALGPSLRLVGSTTFTEYKLPVILPYAVLTGLPGLDFMRTPGRFMLVGYVGLGMVAAYGLQALVQRWNQLAKIVVPAICTGLLLLETWPPMPRPMEQLPEVSDFYRMLGQESEFYGILDLPIKPEQVTTFSDWHLYISSYYQMYQMYHKKGIATGYLSRYYDTHPTLGYLISENSLEDTPLRFDVTIDGKPGDVYANLEHELTRNNYRYVVLHKPQPGIPEMKENSAGLLAARRLVDTVFAGRRPFYEDALITVYHVSPLDTQPLTPNFLLFDRTDAGLDTSGRRWVHSPARFLVTSLVPQMAELEIKPLVFHDTAKDQYFDRARITVESENGLTHLSTTVTVNGVGRIPVALTTGSQIITVTITSDGVAQRPLAMSANAVNLETTGNFSAGCDLYLNSLLQPCQDKSEFGGDHPVAAYGTGWYEGEGDGIIRWRWSTSPSALWLYSPTQRKFQVRFRPVALHDPASPDSKGAAGMINVLLNESSVQQEPVTIGQVTAIDLEATQGWNVITLELASGNFRPVDIDPGTMDHRPLSFAVEPIEIYFDQDPVEVP